MSSFIVSVMHQGQVFPQNDFSSTQFQKRFAVATLIPLVHGCSGQMHKELT